ncbi:MAG: hypothetical protein WD830_09450 [Chloroflexota bacterium]
MPSPSFQPGLAASDRFWANWISDCWFGIDPLPSSIAELVSDADLVIRGPIADLYVGEYWSGSPRGPLAYAKVAIDELLKGEPVSREAGFVEVQMGHAPSDLEEVRAKIPAHDHLWFLDYEDRERPYPMNQSPILGFVYYAPQDMVTVYREIGQVVRVIGPELIRRAYGNRNFLFTLDGTDFEELVEQVREVGTTPSTSYSFARWSPSGERDPNRFAAC